MTGPVQAPPLVLMEQANLKQIETADALGLEQCSQGACDLGTTNTARVLGPLERLGPRGLAGR